MARLEYFSNFPAVPYAINGGPTQFPIDITKRFTITQLLRGKAITFFNYSVEDGERPDIVAHKMYGDERLDWLVLIVNEIQDPFWMWPLSNENLNAMVIQKYGSVSVAYSGVHHYEQIFSAKRMYNNSDGEIVTTPEISFIVDETTYNGLGISARRMVSNYDYENELNESHRLISLVEPAFVPSVIDQYRRVFD